MIGRKGKKTAQGANPKRTSKSAKKKTARAPGRGALFTVMLLFLLSGLVRLGGETGQAIAREVSALSDEPPIIMTGAECEPAAGLPELLSDLKTRATVLKHAKQILPIACRPSLSLKRHMR